MNGDVGTKLPVRSRAFFCRLCMFSQCLHESKEYSLHPTCTCNTDVSTVIFALILQTSTTRIKLVFSNLDSPFALRMHVFGLWEKTRTHGKNVCGPPQTYWLFEVFYMEICLVCGCVDVVQYCLLISVRFFSRQSLISVSWGVNVCVGACPLECTVSLQVPWMHSCLCVKLAACFCACHITEVCSQHSSSQVEISLLHLLLQRAIQSVKTR